MRSVRGQYAAFQSLNSILVSVPGGLTPARTIHPSLRDSADLPLGPQNLSIFFNAGHTRPDVRTSEINKTTLTIPIDLPVVVVVVALLLLERHRLVVVLVLLLDGSLVVLGRCQSGHPPRIHQTLLAVHT